LHERWECSFALGRWLGIQEVDDEVAIFDAYHIGGEAGGATGTGVWGVSCAGFEVRVKVKSRLVSVAPERLRLETECNLRFCDCTRHPLHLLFLSNSLRDS
jgi:hypothetical protein